MELRWEDLEKAHRNLRQIYLYLAATVPGAPADPALQDHLEKILVLSRSVGADLASLAAENGITTDDQSPPTGAPGATSLDRSKLQSITSYLEKVAAWLEGVRAARVPERSAGQLAELVAMTGTMVTILEIGSMPANTGESGADGPAQAPLTAADMRPTGPIAVEVPQVEPLVLEHTFQEPLLRGVEGKFELTTRAMRRIDEFLHSAQLDYDAGELRRFYRQVARWLEATPDGMVLTLRIGGLSGRAEPYPKYQPIKKK
ncbi:MAG: hypothetical protein GXP47_02195 [Acidobacteria bacterium]|nr:hypothetical protein [Acidobacteriota bacterium]